MPVAGNLSGLLTPFQEESPINLLAMIAQAGTEQPEVLAKLLAQAGAPVPTNIPPAGPTVGALAEKAQTIGPAAAQVAPLQPGSRVPGPVPVPLPSPIGPGDIVPTPGLGPILPGQADLSGGGGGPLTAGGPLIPNAIPPGGEGPGGGKLEGLLKALSGLQTPAAPTVPRPPGAIAPRPGGGAPNPELLAQLFALLQGGGGAPGIPSLGQLIAGKGSPGTTAQLTL